MHGREIALVITGVLPGWLSSFALSWVFLSVWLAPGWFGWQGMDELRFIVFIEVATVYGMLLIFAGREERLAWLPVVPVAVLLGLYVGSRVNPLLGFALSAHIVARVAGVWSDLQTARAILNEFVLSIIFLGLAWFAVGLLPLPAFAWTEEAVPFDLWWEVVTWRGGTSPAPFVLPAWGFLYFAMIAGADRMHLAERLERRRGSLM